MPRETRVLIVDDAEGQRLVLGALVENAGHEVEFARDGIEATEKLDGGFDLVLLDARMPGMDGYEVLRHIRASEQHRDLPVVIVTGHDTPEDRRRAQSCGADDFIPKPISKNDIETSLRAILGPKECGHVAPSTGARTV